MRKTTLALGTAATLALAAGSLALPTLASSEPAVAIRETADTAEVVQLRPTTYDPSRSLAPLVQAVEPAVVAIEVEGTREARVPPMFREFLGTPDRRPMRGEGSGFIIRADGLLVTNNHVIDGADSIKVRFSDGRRVEATLIGGDAENDVALLQLPKDRTWPHVELGDSEAAQVGDWVVAVGNPLGLGTTVTTGIISGKGRNLDRRNAFQSFLQTDAAINQGNSGGPLFGLDGKVLGMNTAIIQYANTVGFAVPSHTLSRIIDDLEDDGTVERGFVGIGLQPVDADLALAVGLETPKGAMITEVQPGQPGEKAGLQAGDIILQVNGDEVADVNQAIRAIGSERPGERVELAVLRDGDTRTIKVKLGDRRMALAAASGAPVPSPRAAPPAVDQLERLGVRLRPGTAVSGGPPGVDVIGVDPSGPAADKLQIGDRIIEANRMAVDSPAELREILEGTHDVVMLEVRRDGVRRFVAVKLPPA